MVFHLQQSFVDKNKFVKRNIAVELEALAINVDEYVIPENKELFHEFLRSHVNKFTQNIYHSKDNTFKSLAEIRKNPDIVILSGDKDSSTVILNKTDYVDKVESMIQEGIDNGKYEITTDKTYRDLKNFQSFLYNNFKDHEHYQKMRPVSNQPGRFLATAKTHKFNSFDDITIPNIKLRPIIDQTNTFSHAAAKIVSNYLQPLASNEYVINNTLIFPELVKNVPINDDEEDISYDIESLFTSIPVQNTINYICDEIYTHKKLKPFCAKRLHFKRLLERLTKECVFSVNGRLIKQIDGCPMGGSISVVMAGIFMAKMERDIVDPIKPIFYKRYVDDTYVRRKKGVPDNLFHALNNYHPNIKLTLDEKPKHFLDTVVTIVDGNIQTEVHVKDNKYPVFWSSKVPKRYKRNAINGDLHRASKISSNFHAELDRIRKKFADAGYPKKFIESVIRDFNKPFDPNSDLIIPTWLFDDRKFVSIKVPYCPQNEEISQKFIENLILFTGDKYRFNINWSTRKIQSLFPLKDRVQHLSCVIYEGCCSCGKKYVGETERNADERWSEHNKPSKKSEPAKHLLSNPRHQFEWITITSASNNHLRRKILEAYFIAKYKPSLNDQVESRELLLFRNGIT